MLSVPHYAPLAFSSQSIYLGTKIEDRVYNVVAFYAGHGWTGVPKNALMGRLVMVSATEGRKDTVTKEPCYKCAEGAGGKNWPKRKSVPKTLILR